MVYPLALAVGRYDDGVKCAFLCKIYSSDGRNGFTHITYRVFKKKFGIFKFSQHLKTDVHMQILSADTFLTENKTNIMDG